MTLSRNLLATIVAVFGVVYSAEARVTIDQEQPLVNIEEGFTLIGGDVEQKLAQTFIVGVTGDLAGLRLPISSCHFGELLIELREQNDGRPDGALLRSLRVPTSELPIRFSGFQSFLFATPLAVVAGDRLAFTLQTVGEDSSCLYAPSPDGDTYTRGKSFFESLGNPPGWLAHDGFPGPRPHDLPFKTLMDAPPRSAGPCVIPDRTDPATGLPVVLPIAAFTPACRCFEDASLREFRCGMMHPDFFIVRRVPFPVTVGKSIEEVWRIIPLTKLDGPVRVTLTGDAYEKPVQFEFAQSRDLSKLSQVSAVIRGEGRVFTVKGAAPAKPAALSGLAVIEYPMEDAANEHQKRFGVDTGWRAEDFGQ